MSTQTVETERKYEADAGTALPPLTGLPAVAAESGPAELRLEAEYFDTADLRLLRAGITLRRRRGGTDAGWHLKLPAGPDTRRELRRPLGRARTVPAEFARLVRAYARTAPLQPVARIDTVRRLRTLLDGSGQSLAEVADDTVSARSLGEVTGESRWREVEVELTGGGPALLAAADRVLRGAGLRRPGHGAKLERVLAGRLPAAPAGAGAGAVAGAGARSGAGARAGAGAPGARAGEAGLAAGQVVLAYLARQSAALTAADPGVRRDEPDAVHQMRVASRRLRSALQTFTPVLPAEATGHLRAELKWLGGVLGAARDGEVLIGHVDGLLRQVPGDLVAGPVAATVSGQLGPRQAAARRTALRALDSPRYLALLDELDALIAAPPVTPAASRPAASLRADVARAVRRVRRRARQARRVAASGSEGATAAGEGAAGANGGAAASANRGGAASANGGGGELDSALHETRKAAKRARYAADALAPSAGKPARRLARRLKNVQTVLGEHQDTVVARAALRDLGARAHRAGESGFTFGILHEMDAAAARNLRRAAAAALRQATRRKYRRWLA